MNKQKQQISNEAIARLKDWGMKKNTLVYGKVIHVSQSGMSRDIAFYMLDGSRMVNISSQIAQVLDWRTDSQKNAVKVGGCGMDMVFHTIYTLSEVMGYGKMNQQEWDPKRKGLRLQTI